MNQAARRPGIFVQMSGAPGAGKSTMAKLLRRSIGGVIIDHDVIRSALLEDGVLPFDQVAKSAYRLQWLLAEEMIQQGHNVISDSTCNFPAVVDQGSTLALRYGYAYWYVECKVSNLDLLDERLRARTPMRSQRSGVDCPPEAAAGARTGEDSRAQFRQWIDSPSRPKHNVIIVDAAEDPHTGIDHILQQIIPNLSVETADAQGT